MQVPVIFYHKIDRPAPDSLVRGGFTPPARFARQMAYLKRRGYVFYTASELIEHYRAHGVFPPNGISITLDDGWEDNYTNAFPVLSRLRIKATIFTIPSCIGQTAYKAQAEGEGARPHLTREQILEMSAAGIEFGSHTLNHKLLHEITPAEVRVEVFEAKRQLEELLQKPCKVLAYPAGFFSDEARAACREAGHTAAFTTHYGPTQTLDLYALNRTEILRRDRFLFQFARKVKPFLAARR
ncbi:MAG TPA: polysaccharide deacetylase family protein [Pyrinomonadaceae bacterium]|nr:polysaccharide deacetylase family protein [Pyrinomonadaceae bacterium]